jgi:peptidyl-prolyl cis-trans isomerase A (cyclophilin A)
MIIARRLAIALLFAGAPVLAQDAPPPPTPPLPSPVVAPAPPKPATTRVRLDTSAGPIVLELEKVRAPITTANFLRYVDQKRLDGTTFYRALKFPAETPTGLVQGGVRGAVKRSLPAIAHEPTTKTGLTHDNGAISMARGAVGSAQGDFFIILGNLSMLDANPAATGDKDGYAVFGRVVEGLENVIKVLDAPTSPTAGEGAMKGQMIEKPINIISAKRM